jgi:hypothetical protein
MKAILVSVALSALAAPAFANTAWHPTMSEIGAVYHAEHETSQASRAAVAKEAAELVRTGRIFFTMNALGLGGAPRVAPLDRQSVINAVIAIPASERMLGERG